MRKLTDAQKQFYESALKIAKDEIEACNAEIQRELAAVKERITKLNADKEAVKQIYDGACKILGIANDLETNTPTVTPSIGNNLNEVDVEEDYALEEELIDSDEDEELEY